MGVFAEPAQALSENSCGLSGATTMGQADASSPKLISSLGPIFRNEGLL